MRFFDLINHQHVLLFLVPTLVFILVFGVSLAFSHFHSKDSEERKKYLDWVEHLEFEIFQIPKPTINIFLHVPPEIGQQLVDKKGARDYIGGEKRDIHEDDIQHLKDAEDSYLYLVNNYPNWIKIDCVRDEQILSREEIHQKVWEVVQKII